MLREIISEHDSMFSRRDAPGSCEILALKEGAGDPKKGAGKTGCPLHPQPRVQKVVSTRSSTTGSPGPGFPRAMVLTAYFVLSPVTGFLPPSSREKFRAT